MHIHGDTSTPNRGVGPRCSERRGAVRAGQCFSALAWPPGSRGMAGVPRSLRCAPRSRPLGDFAAVPGAALGGALGRPGRLAFAQAAPLGRAGGDGGGDGVGAAVHHPGVQAVGHGEGLEAASQGQGQRELVHQVHGGAGHHRPAAQVLQAQHWGRKRSRAQASLPPASGQPGPPTHHLSQGLGRTGQENQG